METSIKLKATRLEFEDFLEHESLYPFYFKYYEVDKDSIANFRNKGYKGDLLFDVLIRHPEATRIAKNKTYTIDGMIKSLSKKAVVKEPIVKTLENLNITKQYITYPMHGNRHSQPYGSLRVENSQGNWKTVDIKEDGYKQYITFNRLRYYVKNTGRYMSANFVLDKEETNRYYADKGFRTEWI